MKYYDKQIRLIKRLAVDWNRRCVKMQAGGINATMTAWMSCKARRTLLQDKLHARRIK